MSEESREYPTVKPGDTVTIEVTDIDGKVYRTRCQIVDGADSAVSRTEECDTAAVLGDGTMEGLFGGIDDGLLDEEEAEAAE